jgi:enoyl-CoA hydratase
MANLLTQIENNVLLITVNRPEKLNALNHATLTELLHTIEEAKEDDHIRALVITGSGEKAFVAGADIAELAETDAISGLRFAEFGQRVMDAIENSPKPVIAAVNGFALGGGCELAMACHLRLASDNARFGQPEIKLGVIPGFGGTQRLTRLVGKGRAMELNLLGEMIDAPRAEAIGLVNQVLPQAELLPTAMKLASKLAQSAPVALSMIIDSINHGAECALPEALAYEAKAFAVCCATEDKAEGTRAFLEKRAARFSGK